MRLNILIYILLFFTSVTYGQQGTFIKGPALIEGFSEIATAAGTSTLTKDSQTNQFFTGTSTQTVVLPNATTIPLGRYFVIQNKSTGAVTVNLNGGSLLTVIDPDTQVKVTLTAAFTSAGTWNVSTSGALSSILGVDLGGTGLDGSAAANGSLLIGNGTGYSLSTLTGTTNRVTVTNGAGSITLSGPQDLATTSTPTFGSLTLTSPLTVGNGGTGTATAFTQGSAIFAGASGVYSQDNANYFWDDTNNRLGIGTATPQLPLHVLSTAPAANPVPYRGGMIIEAEGTNSAIISSTSYSDTTAAGFIGQRSRGTLASPTTIDTNDVITSYLGRVYRTTGAWNTVAGMIAQADQTHTSTALGSSLSFNTTSNNSTLIQERMRITNNGNVGIGLTAPAARLHQDSGTGANTLHKFTSGTTTGQLAADGFDVGYLAASGAYLWNNENSPMEFGTNNTFRMQISAAGLVSIGTTAPATSAKLDIQGSDGALLLPRLTTTQKNALTPTAGMQVYDTTLGRFECYTTAWSGCGSFTRQVTTAQRNALPDYFGQTVWNTDTSKLEVQQNTGRWAPVITFGSSAQTSLANNDSIALNTFDMDQTVRVGATAGGGVGISTDPLAPFLYAATKPDGLRVTLVGTSDTLAVTILGSDTANGILAPDITLGRGQTATYRWEATLDRWVLTGSSN